MLVSDETWACSYRPHVDHSQITSIRTASYNAATAIRRANTGAGHRGRDMADTLSVELADDHLIQRAALRRPRSSVISRDSEQVTAYATCVAYIVTLPFEELSAIQDKLRAEQRLTKALSKGLRATGPNSGAELFLLLGESRHGNPESSHRRLAWVGVVAQHNTVGAVDRSITVEPLRECFEMIILDGELGLLRRFPSDLRAEFERAAPHNGTGICSDAVWDALYAALRDEHPGLMSLIDWLIAQTRRPALNSRDPADRAWQEQQDATGNILRIAEFPLSALAAWQRPLARDDPYLSGLIPQPVEHSLIDHDIRVSDQVFNLTSKWRNEDYGRCDIHVLADTEGRRLEVVNVNATPIEARLGTDMIYYHEPTHSFVLVQYKRLDPVNRSIYVDERLRNQLERLSKVAELSRPPAGPREWRLGSDSCFLKLAYWPNDGQLSGLAPGMYLPLSYVQMLLEDDCTRGTRVNSQARLLGYGSVERHLVSTQFIDLVKHGLAGTVGTSFKQLRDLVEKRAEAGQSVVMAVEHSNESISDRQRRHRDRSSKRKGFGHSAHTQESLF